MLCRRVRLVLRLPRCLRLHLPAQIPPRLSRGLLSSLRLLRVLPPLARRDNRNLGSD